MGLIVFLRLASGSRVIHFNGTTHRRCRPQATYSEALGRYLLANTGFLEPVSMTPHSYFPQFAYKGTQLTLYEAPAPQGAPCVCTLPCHLFLPCASIRGRRR